MKQFARFIALFVAGTFTVIISTAQSGAQDWPQWRGANRDARAGFKAPATWPRELKEKWRVTVGEGVATPALVGDRLYVFSREGVNEVLRCLEAGTGKEVWQEKYESLGATGPAQSFSGPRSSPTVAEGKVVTLGVRGVLSCLDAANGKLLWRKHDIKGYPAFFPSSSPIIVDGKCIAQLGGREDGAIVAFDLTAGEEKWKWSGSSPAYASPTLMTLNGTKLIIAQTESDTVAVNAADGKLAWKSGAAEAGAPAEAGRGRGGGGRDYKAATPIVDGQTIIIAGRGIKAIQLAKEGDKIAAKELWNSPDKSVIFNTPVLKNGVLYGLSGNNELFAVDTKNPQTGWTAPFPTGETAPVGAEGGRGRGRGGGYGSIVDVGSALLALTPSSQLVAFMPNPKEFKVLANYKVSGSQTHAHPVASGNRIFIKDQNSVALFTLD
jgi:outer membrane protein assembly factor BamB